VLLFTLCCVISISGIIQMQESIWCFWPCSVKSEGRSLLVPLVTLEDLKDRGM